MPLADDIEEFRRNVAKAIEELEEVRSVSDKLTECAVDEMHRHLTQLQDLCEQASIEIKRATDQLIEIKTKWGSEPLKKYSRQISPDLSTGSLQWHHEFKNMGSREVNLNNFENNDFLRVIQAVLQAQDEFSVFPSLNQVKGSLGESLCHVILDDLFQDTYFLEGQLGLSIDISSEDLAYKAAQKFFARTSGYKFAVAGRPFGGGQPYSLDAVAMLISKNDAENWLQNQKSTATYFVFESKTDTARLSTSQKQFSYVQRQALYMFNNKNKIEDRSQLGQDLLKALDEGRVFYITSHVDLLTGKLTARFIQ